MKKTKRVLLALTCLLAAVILTVGCTFTGSRTSGETPAPDAASDASTAPATEPQQNETEAPAETEPSTQAAPPTEAADKKESPAPVVPLYDTEITGFHSDEFSVIVGNSVYYTNPDGIYRMYEGQETLLYSGSFTNHWVCTDGKLLYTVDAAGDVLQLDLAAGKVRILFNAGPFAYVVGASDEALYLGLQENEQDWWGYDLCVYSFDGTLLEQLGEDLAVRMVDGILCCNDFRSDVRTVPFQAYDRTGAQIVDAVEMSTYCVRGGAVYYIGLDEGYTMENVSYSDNYTSSLFRVDGNGTTVLTTFQGMPFGMFCGDALALGGEKMYSLENGAELPRNLVNNLFFNGTSLNNQVGKDENGKWYSIDQRDEVALRENDKGEFVQCSACPESMNFIGLCGDWVYTYEPYYETITVTGTYIPVP